MTTASTGSTSDEHARFIHAVTDPYKDRGFTPDEAIVWTHLRTGQAALPPRVCHIVRDYLATDLDAPIDTRHAMEWFLLDVPPRQAGTYTWRGWAPVHLIDLRRAIHETAPPNLIGGRPMDRQPYEADWIYTNIAPELAPLYVLAGKDPAAAQTIDRRRRLTHDTTTVPALRTIAALRRGPSAP